jgi:hypothetical protein
VDSELPRLDIPDVVAAIPTPEHSATAHQSEAGFAEAPVAVERKPAESSPTMLHAAFEQRSPSGSKPTLGNAATRVTDRNSFARSATVDSNAQLRNLVILVALGTLGIGIALLWVASERRLENVAAPEPVELEPVTLPEPAASLSTAGEQSSDSLQTMATDSDDLGELIRGELPVQDEPVVLPARVALHGKAVGQKRLVIHPAQGLAGPHFSEPAKAPEKVPATRHTTPVSRTPAAPSAVRGQNEPEGLLDRVLLAMQREGRR